MFTGPPVTADRVIFTVMQNDQTIVAPATAAGEGGIGIVRLSGPLSLSTLLCFFYTLLSL